VAGFLRLRRCAKATDRNPVVGGSLALRPRGLQVPSRDRRIEGRARRGGLSRAAPPLRAKAGRPVAPGYSQRRVPSSPRQRIRARRGHSHWRQTHLQLVDTLERARRLGPPMSGEWRPARPATSNSPGGRPRALRPGVRQGPAITRFEFPGTVQSGWAPVTRSPGPPVTGATAGSSGPAPWRFSD
jgi:hypothetical protein